MFQEGYAYIGLFSLTSEKTTQLELTGHFEDYFRQNLLVKTLRATITISLHISPFC